MWFAGLLIGGLIGSLGGYPSGVFGAIVGTIAGAIIGATMKSVVGEGDGDGHSRNRDGRTSDPPLAEVERRIAHIYKSLEDIHYRLAKLEPAAAPAETR